MFDNTNVNHPPDSPLMLVPIDPKLDPAVSRQVDAQRRQLREVMAAATEAAQARDAWYTHLGIQSIWMCVGSYIFYSGYRGADVSKSLIAPYTTNLRLIRAGAPMAVVGLGMLGLTAAFIPGDLRCTQDAVDYARWMATKRDDEVAKLQAMIEESTPPTQE